MPTEESNSGSEGVEYLCPKEGRKGGWRRRMKDKAGVRRGLGQTFFCQSFVLGLHVAVWSGANPGSASLGTTCRRSNTGGPCARQTAFRLYYCSIFSCICCEYCTHCIFLNWLLFIFFFI